MAGGTGVPRPKQPSFETWAMREAIAKLLTPLCRSALSVLALEIVPKGVCRLPVTPRELPFC